MKDNFYTKKAFSYIYTSLLIDKDFLQKKKVSHENKISKNFL